jgi:hypothetical protein
MKTFLPYFLAVASLIAAVCLGISWSRGMEELDDKDAQAQKQAKEIQELHKQLAVANATNDMLTKRLQLAAKLPFATPSNELDAAERHQRIPDGATDPDKMWKNQMKGAQDAIKAAGMANLPSRPK